MTPLIKDWNECERRLAEIQESEESFTPENLIDIERMFEIGLKLFQEEDRRPRSYLQAIEWFERAARFGFPAAIGKLGKCYLESFGVDGFDKDEARGFELLEVAAGLHDQQSVVDLARCYQFGLGIKADIRRAKQILADAATAGNHDAFWALDGVLANTSEDDADWDEDYLDLENEIAAIKLSKGAIVGAFFRNGRFRGDAVINSEDFAVGDAVSNQARFHLGNIFSRERNYTFNEERAVSYFRKSAMDGYSPSMRRLADFYAKGSGGLPKDQTLALAWYRRGAENGCGLCKMIIAEQYETELGTKSDRAHETLEEWLARFASKAMTDDPALTYSDDCPRFTIEIEYRVCQEDRENGSFGEGERGYRIWESKTSGKLIWRLPSQIKELRKFLRSSRLTEWTLDFEGETSNVNCEWEGSGSENGNGSSDYNVEGESRAGKDQSDFEGDGDLVRQSVSSSSYLHGTPSFFLLDSDGLRIEISSVEDLLGELRCRLNDA